MIGRYRNGAIPSVGDETDLERSVREAAERSIEGVREGLDRYDPQRALDSLWLLVTRANRYVEESAPWSLAREARNGDDAANRRLDTALATLAESLRVISILLEPFLPHTSRRIREQLGLPEGPAGWETHLSWGQLPAGTQVSKPEPIFPRLEESVAAG